jgi:hypothetical protein
MTQDEIIRFAIQCYIVTTPGDRINMDAMTKFAALVAAKEREACARVCADGLGIVTNLNALDDIEAWGKKFAKAIRARGEA